VPDCALGCEQQRDWEIPAAAAESTGFRLRDGALEPCAEPAMPRQRMGENHQPGRDRGDALSVQRQVTAGFAPELSVTLAARSARQMGWRRGGAAGDGV
jgi:prepilin peptidase dependent protein B